MTGKGTLGPNENRSELRQKCVRELLLKPLHSEWSATEADEHAISIG
jgi:hypothetical protein